MSWIKDTLGIFGGAFKYKEYKEISEFKQKMKGIEDENLKLREEGKKLVLKSNDEIQSLKAEIEDLNEKLQMKEKLIKKDNVYWLGEDGPFCPKCWEDEEKKISMLPMGDGSHVECTKCQTSVELYPEKNSYMMAKNRDDDFDPYSVINKV